MLRPAAVRSPLGYGGMPRRRARLVGRVCNEPYTKLFTEPSDVLPTYSIRPTIDIYGRKDWGADHGAKRRRRRSTAGGAGGGGHAGLVAASACDLGPNSAGARGGKMAFSGVGGERAQELAGWRRATPYGERRRPSFDWRNVTGGQRKMHACMQGEMKGGEEGTTRRPTARAAALSTRTPARARRERC